MRAEILNLLEKTRAHLFRLAEKLPDDETTDMARRHIGSRPDPRTGTGP